MKNNIFWVIFNLLYLHGIPKIIVIRKKSGKWRLFHDLRAINAQMNLFGSIQRGLPLLSALPKQWKIVILDSKDCFFSIPLCHQDRPRFAFTIPALNHMEPDKRFQWKVLPQGMANSPTLAQKYVVHVIQPVRNAWPQIYILHYMDDILLAAPNKQQAFSRLQQLQKTP